MCLEFEERYERILRTHVVDVLLEANVVTKEIRLMHASESMVYTWGCTFNSDLLTGIL